MVDSATRATLHVQVPRQALARIEALAAQTGHSTSDLVGEALTNYLDYQEWKATAIAEAIAASDAGEEPIEHERMVEWLNSWGTEHELPPPQRRSFGIGWLAPTLSESVSTSLRPIHNVRRS